MREGGWVECEIYIYIFIGFLCDKVYVIKNLEAQLICNMHVSAINKLAYTESTMHHPTIENK